jgi:hypothetical protein
MDFLKSLFLISFDEIFILIIIKFLQVISVTENCAADS